MSIDLLKHNQKAYEAAVLMLSETGKAAVIHPTGTGKSFIGFKLCEDNPEKTVCWLSPSDYIFQTQLENLKDISPDTTLDNVRYFTYVKLMNLTEAELLQIKPDFIILDEFHRAGAEFWSEGVKQLDDSYLRHRTLRSSSSYVDYAKDIVEHITEDRARIELCRREKKYIGLKKEDFKILSEDLRYFDLCMKGPLSLYS